MYVGVAVVKVTQHLCQKQLQSSSLSCSFIIPYTHTHTYTHTCHIHTHIRNCKCWQKFSFLSILLDGATRKTCRANFYENSFAPPSVFICCLFSSPLLTLSLSSGFLCCSAQTITKVTFNIIFGLLLVARIPHFSLSIFYLPPFPVTCHYPVTMTANWLLFVSF